MKHIAGGQLVQETDRHAATWGARVVLVDDDGVRATMTAHWMQQMGWDVAVMSLDMFGAGARDRALCAPCARAGRRVGALDRSGRRCRRGCERTVRWWSIWTGAAATSQGTFRAPVTPSARAWPRRSPHCRRRRRSCSPPRDGVLARLAAAEWNGRAPAPVLALSGGTAAWVAAGYGLERGADADGQRAGGRTAARARTVRRASRTRCGPTWRGRSTW